ncbi:hypothetical protein CU633_16175 [Bacillus sp. V3-13]|uniref:MBL fold metallo-hydrolase n=1 Tax=Bacillus sp. V3-13 TaxID=2053728 RepID=UPI000C7722D2|nr:MBL fold metallo-hydrolase [Bacillus sp. V3-13]PLR76495.1 hypothetical protein CU633_16175 [Bacillus sp. V3-13]
MKWIQMPLGPLQTNCYIIYNDRKSCLIIDPGEEAGKVISAIEAEELKPQAVLLTHAHFDHIGAVDAVREKFNIPVYVHEKEANWLGDPTLNGSEFFMAGKVRAKAADHFLAAANQRTIGDFTFQVFETPGHSPGSVSIYFAEAEFVAAGDALFNGSIGRTDLPGGNHDQLIKSIHDHLLTLPEETEVLPGHGPTTTIGAEMDGNPFLNGF